MSQTRLVLWFALALFVGQHTADACTCVPSGPPCQAYWEAGAVFVGRVESIRSAASKSPLAGRRVSFEVVESFTGVNSRRVLVETGRGGGDCGYAFKTGATYLVHANRHPQTGELSTSICSRTRPVEAATDDVEYARAVISGTASKGRISGKVTVGHDSLQPGGRMPAPRPLAGVTVFLDHAGVSLPAASGKDGSFLFEGLEPGKYTARLDVPAGYYSGGFPRELELRDARACVELEAVLFVDGRVSGRVLNRQAQSIAGLTVELTVRAGIDQPFGPRRLRTNTRGDGSYEFARVPPGRYVIGINTQLDRAGRVPEGRVFLPGVRDPATAREIVVDGGEQVQAGDLVLPDDVGYLMMTGIVLDSDGAPAEGVRVYLKGSPEDYIVAEPVLTDAGGRFVLAGLAGREYLIFAERVRSGAKGGGLELSNPVLSIPAEGSIPIVLRLKRKY